jgi:hypothetical protein
VFIGFLHNRDGLGPRFVSTATPSPLALHAFDYSYFRWGVLDCRHGHVLLKDDTKLSPSVNLVVWDPATGKQKLLPEPPLSFPQLLDYTAVVVCAVRGCDHLDSTATVAHSSRRLGGLIH